MSPFSISTVSSRRLQCLLRVASRFSTLCRRLDVARVAVRTVAVAARWKGEAGASCERTSEAAVETVAFDIMSFLNFILSVSARLLFVSLASAKMMLEIASSLLSQVVAIRLSLDSRPGSFARLPPTTKE